MDLNVCLVLSFLTYSVFVTSSSAELCTNDAFNSCIKTLKPYGFYNGNPIPPIHNESTWITVCRLQQESHECISKFRDNCEHEDILILIGQEDADEYLCTDGFQDFLKSQTCLHTLAVQSAYTKCGDTYQHKLDAINQYSYDAKAQSCSYLKSLLGCYEESVGGICGKSAASYEAEFNLRYFAPVAYAINCDIDKPKPTDKDESLDGRLYQGIGAAIGFLFLTMIIMTIFGISARKRKLLRHQQRSTVAYNGNSAHVAAPPTGPGDTYNVYNPGPHTAPLSLGPSFSNPGYTSGPLPPSYTEKAHSEYDPPKYETVDDTNTYANDAENDPPKYESIATGASENESVYENINH